jgi:hypothetical protein
VPLIRVNGFRIDLFDNLARLAPPFVYAVWDGEFVKVGHSRTHPRTHMAELQTGSSRELVLLAYDARVTEREVHKRLRRHRHRGEWFRPTPDVLKEIARWDWVDGPRLAALRDHLSAREGGAVDEQV